MSAHGATRSRLVRVVSTLVVELVYALHQVNGRLDGHSKVLADRRERVGGGVSTRLAVRETTPPGPVGGHALQVGIPHLATVTAVQWRRGGRGGISSVGRLLYER